MNVNEYLIKTGNPFSLLFILRNGKTREPVEITDEMQFTSTIINNLGHVIAECEVVICDQVTKKGGVLFKVDQTVTKRWKAGTAVADIKLAINGQERNSGNYSFKIEKSIS